MQFQSILQNLRDVVRCDFSSTCCTKDSRDNVHDGYARGMHNRDCPICKPCLPASPLCDARPTSVKVNLKNYQNGDFGT
jgi:hypothetical protein